jgi:hypothetical protein
MIRLLLLAAAGFLGYRLAREYIGDIPAEFRTPGPTTRKAPARNSAREKPRKG